MAQYNTNDFVICGERHNYYSYDGELYTDTFPYDWAENHIPNTGPKDCANCAEYGSWNGVFVGYCPNCALDYDGKRGSGFSSYGEEQDKSHELSANNTYMAGVWWLDIGDTDLVDSVKLYRKHQRDDEYHLMMRELIELEKDEDKHCLPEDRYQMHCRQEDRRITAEDAFIENRDIYTARDDAIDLQEKIRWLNVQANKRLTQEK